MFALISNPELNSQGKILVKQLKNRYNDPTSNQRFVVGVDRSKMRLYDVDQSSSVPEDDVPVFDNTEAGRKMSNDKFRNFKL